MTRIGGRLFFLLAVLGLVSGTTSALAQDDFGTPPAGSGDATPPPAAGEMAYPPPAATTAAPATSPTTAAATAPAPEPEPAAPHAEPEHPDDGPRHRHFWLDASIGYSWIDLVALDQSGLIPDPQQTRSSGMVAEAGLGVAFSVLRVGVAGTYAQYKGFDVATAELDVTLVIPIPVVQPYIEAGFGYGWVGNVTETNGSGTTAAVAIHGIAIDAGLGVDIHVSDVVQFGIGAEASFLNLQRQRVTQLNTINNVNFDKPGTSLGLQINGIARLTFQF